MRRARTILSAALIGGGVLLLFLGSRDFLESRLGQAGAEEEFNEHPAPASLPAERHGSAAVASPPPAAGRTIAKLAIPRLGSELYVVEGDGARELRRGPGHLSGTAFPGQNGNCVIAGHRDTHFRVLKDIRKGDDIVIETAAGKFLYRVRSMRVVSPRNVSALQPTSDAELNLITCYPFYYLGSAPKRLVVEAALAGMVGGRGSAENRASAGEFPGS
jgi:sortase A